MTIDRPRQWIKEHGLKQREAALICGVTERTVRNWCANKPPMPVTAQRLMLVWSGDMSRDELDELRR
jgi:hypothetical protein